jgi:hypothetical protein
MVERIANVLADSTLGITAFRAKVMLLPIVMAASYLAQQDVKQEADRSAFLVVCDTSPSKIIVLDDTGKWLHRVRETEIKIDTNATMKCIMYEGHYRPSNPEIKTWRLAQIKTVTEAEFQSMINNLQNDPDAVRKQMSQDKNN